MYPHPTATVTKETGFFTDINGLNQIFGLKNPVSGHLCVSSRVCRYPPSLRKTDDLNSDAPRRFNKQARFLLASFFIGHEMLDLFIDLLTKIRCVAIRLSLFFEDC